MALVVDGVNQYGEIAAGFTDLFSGKTNWTLSLWAKLDAVANQPILIATKGRVTNGFLLEFNAGTGAYIVAATTTIQSTNWTVPTGTWVNLIASRSSAKGHGEIWFQGLPYYSATLPAIDSATAALYLARYDAGAPYYLDGKLADIRAWDRILTPTEKRKVWAGQSVPTNLTAWWKLDESSGTTFADSAGSHPGSLFNTPTWDGDFPTYGTLEAGESGGRPSLPFLQQVIG